MTIPTLAQLTALAAQLSADVAKYHAIIHGSAPVATDAGNIAPFKPIMDSLAANVMVPSGVATLSLLNADIGSPPGTLKFVTSDPVDGNNWLYRSQGAGVWVKANDHILAKLTGRQETFETKADFAAATVDPLTKGVRTLGANDKDDGYGRFWYFCDSEPPGILNANKILTGNGRWFKSTAKGNSRSQQAQSNGAGFELSPPVTRSPNFWQYDRGQTWTTRLGWEPASGLYTTPAHEEFDYLASIFKHEDFFLINTSKGGINIDRWDGIDYLWTEGILGDGKVNRNGTITGSTQLNVAFKDINGERRALYSIDSTVNNIIIESIANPTTKFVKYNISGSAEVSGFHQHTVTYDSHLGTLSEAEPIRLRYGFHDGTIEIGNIHERWKAEIRPALNQLYGGTTSKVDSINFWQMEDDALAGRMARWGENALRMETAFFSEGYCEWQCPIAYYAMRDARAGLDPYGPGQNEYLRQFVRQKSNRYLVDTPKLLFSGYWDPSAGGVHIYPLGSRVLGRLVAEQQLKGTGQESVAGLHISQALLTGEMGAVRANAGFHVSSYRNKVVNGDFSHNTRGTTYTIAAGASRYTLDGVFINNLTNQPMDVSQQSFFASGLTLGEGAKNWLRCNFANAATTDFFFVEFRIPDVQTLAELYATLTAWLAVPSSTGIAAYLIQNFGTGGSPAAEVSTLVFADNAFVSSAFSKKSGLVALPSVIGKSLGSAGNHHLKARIIVTPRVVGNFDLARVSVVQDDATKEFDCFTPRPPEVEEYMCQRLVRGIPKLTMNGYGKATVPEAMTFALSPPMARTPSVETAPTITPTNAGSTAVSALGPDSIKLITTPATDAAFQVDTINGILTAELV